MGGTVGTHAVEQAVGQQAHGGRSSGGQAVWTRWCGGGGRVGGGRAGKLSPATCSLPLPSLCLLPIASSPCSLGPATPFSPFQPFPHFLHAASALLHP